MRIISGHLKGRLFAVPKSFPSRPTTDFAKEGLFNILGNQLDFEGLKILDLCADTGNLSFEFVSRGATEINCVDVSPKVISWLQKNANLLGIQDKLKANVSDVLTFLNRTTQQYDVIIADPPYELNIHSQIVQSVFERSLLTNGGMLIIEHSKRTDLTKETNYSNTRTFGNVNFSFFE